MNNNLTIRFTLIADGSSDAILLTIVKWLLDDLYPNISNEGLYADFRNQPNPPKRIQDKVQRAKKIYPYNLLLIHRDAETNDLDSIQQRKTEVASNLLIQENTTVIIVPVKMMETWLLIDEQAIKKAAGNRNYQTDMNLPRLKDLERHPNPKTLLHDLLKNASGLKGRNLDKFNPHQAVHLVAENIEDFSALRQLSAFQILEADIRNAVDTMVSG
jgi:hypothetical protein